MFVTMQPCFRCANRIYQAGIKKVYFLEEYRDLSGIMMLLNAGVQVYQVEQDSIRELTKSYVLNKDKQRTMVVLGVDFQVLRGQWNVNARPTAGHRGVILSHDMNSIQELKEKALKYLCDSDSYIHALEARLYEVTEKIYAKIISGEIGILTGHEYLKLINELDIKPKE